MSKKKRPRETKSKDENEGKRERDEEKDEGTAGGILKGLGNIIPGLGGLVKSLEKSPAFKERLKQVDKELEHKIRSAPLKRRGGQLKCQEDLVEGLYEGEAHQVL